MRPSRPRFRLGMFLLPLLLGPGEIPAQLAPVELMSNDEVVAKLLAGRPVGERVLVMPPRFETLTDVSTVQNAQNTPAGMAAWRDTYGRDGTDEYAVRQFFVPMKVWQEKNAEQLLDEAAKQLTTDSGAVLVARKKYELDDCPGRSFVLRHTATGKWIRVDYLVIYPDLITVTFTGTPAGLQSSRVVDFFNSLKTEPAGETKTAPKS